MISGVIDDVAGRVAAGNAFAAEENVFVGDVAAQIRLVENFRARAVPIDFAVGFFDAVAIAVVSIVHTSGGFNFTFGVPAVGVVAIGQDVAGSIVGKAGGGKLIVGQGRDAEAFLRAAVVRTGGHADRG